MRRSSSSDGSEREASRANQAQRNRRHAHLTTRVSRFRDHLAAGRRSCEILRLPQAPDRYCGGDDYRTDPYHLSACVQLFAANDKLDLVFADQEDRRGEQVVSAIRMGPLVAQLNRGPSQTHKAFDLTKRDCIFKLFSALKFLRHGSTAVRRRGSVLGVGPLRRAVRSVCSLHRIRGRGDVSRCHCSRAQHTRLCEADQRVDIL